MSRSTPKAARMVVRRLPMEKIIETASSIDVHLRRDNDDPTDLYAEIKITAFIDGPGTIDTLASLFAAAAKGGAQ